MFILGVDKITKTDEAASADVESHYLQSEVGGKMRKHFGHVEVSLLHRHLLSWQNQVVDNAVLVG